MKPKPTTEDLAKALAKRLREAKKKYRELHNAFCQFNLKVRYPKSINMWVYPCDGTTYTMEYLRERVIAANSLGFDVSLEANDEGKLRVNYVAKRPAKPYELEMDYYRGI